MELLVCLLMVAGSFARPVSQPVYSNPQYISAQQTVPAGQQYRQHPLTYLQTHYISAQPVPALSPALQATRPVYEDRGAGLQKYSTQIRQPIQLLQSTQNLAQNTQQQAQPQYQLQKEPPSSAPLYLAQQLQTAHQLGQQAQQALAAAAAAQRKVTPQTLTRQYQQQQQQPTVIPQQPQPQQPQQQYLRETPQQTQIKYVKPAAAVAQSYRPVAVSSPGGQEQRDPQEDYDPNPSYQFGFDVSDDLYTNYQNRKEQREGNKITGSYSVVDSDGFVRTVTYTADPKEGFKAEVTRQPTDIVVKIPKPDPQFQRKQQQQQQPQYVQVVPVHEKSQPQAQKQNLIYQYQQ